MAVHYRPHVAIISSGCTNSSQIRIYLFLGWRVAHVQCNGSKLSILGMQTLLCQGVISTL